MSPEVADPHQSPTSTAAPLARPPQLAWSSPGCELQRKDAQDIPVLFFSWNGLWKGFIWWVKAAMHTRNSSHPRDRWFLCTKVSYQIPGRTLQVKWPFSSSSFMLGNCASWLLRGFVLVTMLVTGWGFLDEDCLEDGDASQNLTTLLPYNTGFTRALPLPGPWGGVIKTGGGAPLPSRTMEKAKFCCFYDLHTLLEKWKELNVVAFGSAFPACCRYFLPNSSKKVIHGIGCTFLSAPCTH